MAETKIAKIKVRRGASSVWSANNPVLDFGEIGIEDTGNGPIGYLMKIGDGTSAWNSLPYTAGRPLAVARSLDLTSTGQTAVLTVPTGGVILVSSAHLLHKTVTTYPSSVTVRLGSSTSQTQLVNDYSLTVSGSNDATTFGLGSFYYTAGTELQFGVVAASGSATHTADLVLEGVLIPA